MARVSARVSNTLFREYALCIGVGHSVCVDLIHGVPQPGKEKSVVDEWNVAPSMAHSRCGALAGTIANTLFVAGGASSQVSYVCVLFLDLIFELLEHHLVG